MYIDVDHIEMHWLDEFEWEKRQMITLVQGIEAKRATRPNWNGNDWSIEMPTDRS